MHIAHRPGEIEQVQLVSWQHLDFVACATGRETTPPSCLSLVAIPSTLSSPLSHICLLVTGTHASAILAALRCAHQHTHPLTRTVVHATLATHTAHSSRNRPQVDVVSFHSYNGNQTDLALQIAKLRKVAEASGKPLGFASEIMNRPVDPAVHVYSGVHT